MQRFTDLKVWQRSHALALQVYRLTKTFPADERFGLTAQLRRAALSVPTNIAEGSKRQSRQDYARFLNIAEGSLAETEYLLMFSRDLGYVVASTIDKVLVEIDEIARMLSNLRSRVEQGGFRKTGTGTRSTSETGVRPNRLVEIRLLTLDSQL